MKSGELFVKNDRVFVLLYNDTDINKRKVHLYGAWGGLKGYNPFIINKKDLIRGYEDYNLMNKGNYYIEIPIKISGKIDELSIEKALKTNGFKRYNQ